MNCKRFLIASLVIFVVITGLDYLITNYLMMASYEAFKHVWRPDMARKMWMWYPIGLLTSLLFTYIFIKGREDKGLLEGVRYGIIIWLFVSVPVSVSFYVLIPIPYTMAVKWMAIGLLEMLVSGVLVAAIYKPAAPKAA